MPRPRRHDEGLPSRYYLLLSVDYYGQRARENMKALFLTGMNVFSGCVSAWEEVEVALGELTTGLDC